MRRLLENADAIEVLSNIEGFRSLNDDIETVINKSEHVKKEGGKLTPKEEKDFEDMTRMVRAAVNRMPMKCRTPRTTGRSCKQRLGT